MSNTNYPLGMPEKLTLDNIEEVARNEVRYYMRCRRANAGHFEHFSKQRFLLLMRIRRALRATGVK